MKNAAAMIMTFVMMGAGLTQLKALEIPLSGGGGGGEGQKIAYVDMDKIYQISPQTKYAKEDYAKRLEKKREFLSSKEKELEDISNRISVLETTVKGLNASVSTGTADRMNDNPQSLLNLKNDLEVKKLELEEEKAKADEELAIFEKQQSQIILGKIYQSLKEIATEEQVNLIVDKSSILFGSAEIDLTQKLQERIRGY